MSVDDIVVELDLVDGDVALVRVTTPSGWLEIIGVVRIDGRRLTIDRARVDGPGAGTLGRAGLDAIGRKLMVEADVDEIVVQGGARTTGRNRGRPPEPIRFARQAPPESRR